MRVRGVVAFAIVALATACRTLPFPDPHLEGEYGQSLKKWTRRVALYSGLETRAFVRVVYLSPDFVNAQAKELSRMRAEMPDQAAVTLARMRAEYRQPSFFAVVYIPDKTANDWNERESVWRLALNMGFGEQAPDRVTRYEVPFNAELRILYPYIDDYSVAYLVRFPDPAAPPGVAASPQSAFTPVDAQLVAAGALGKMQFHWRLDGGPEEPASAEAGPPKNAAPNPKP
ncbi:MAG TPA: hypothetical protein VFE90_20510 [Myxococcales bacterium]|nr:hypothetical protein [Myxococcales bacterium]